MLAEDHSPDPVEWPNQVFASISKIADVPTTLNADDGASSGDGDGSVDESTAATVVTGKGMAPLASWLLERINVGTAAYQMVHVLGEGVVLQCDEDRTEVNATYFEEMPLAHFNRRFRGLPRLYVPAQQC